MSTATRSCLVAGRHQRATGRWTMSAGIARPTGETVAEGMDHPTPNDSSRSFLGEMPIPASIAGDIENAKAGTYVI